MSVWLSLGLLVAQWVCGTRAAVAKGRDSEEVYDRERVLANLFVLVALLRLPSRAQGAQFESRRSELHPALCCPRSPISIRSVSVTHNNSHPSLHYVP